MNRYVIIDFETTGNKPGKDKVIQIGAVLIEDHCIKDQFSSFVNPEMPLTTFIQSFTGITDNMLEHAPSFSEVAPELLAFLQGAYLVAHNVPFDLSFLQKELEGSGNEIFTGKTIDTVELSRVLLTNVEGYKLNQLAKEFSITHENPHRADSDAEVTAKVFLRLLEKLDTLPLITIEHLESLLKSLKSDIDIFLSEYIHQRRKLKHFNENKYDIFRGLALKRPMIEDNKEEVVDLSFSSFKEVLSTKMEELLPNYEQRNGQYDMMTLVDEALSTHQYLVIEAGTGTGKSLAYLLPSVIYSKVNGKKIVVSTYTVQLQQQLLENEIPVIQKLVPFRLKVSLIKGRDHYLCLRKFEYHLNDIHENNYDTVLTKAQILVWLTETEEGDFDELNLPSGGRLFWNQIKSESNTCANSQCPWFSKCFYQRKKSEADKADILITNHSLLLADVVHEAALLPNYEEVIIDEAQHLEDAACDHFGKRLEYVKVQSELNRIGSVYEDGILSKAYRVFKKFTNDKATDIFFSLDDQISELKLEIDDIFRLIKFYVLNKNDCNLSEVGRISYRYDLEHENNWNPIFELADRINFQFKAVIKRIKHLLSIINPFVEKLNFKERVMITDLKGTVESISEMNKSFSHLLLEKKSNEVYWIEVVEKGAQNATHIFSQPIEISDFLADQFFAKKQSVVLTSATLTINQSFSYMITRLGLNDFYPITAQVESPFDYAKQVCLMVPDDLPHIKEVTQEEFVSSIAWRILQIGRISKGRMFVLFTSFEMLKDTFDYVKQLSEQDEFLLIGQGITSGSRSKLIKTFKQVQQAILFGTNSFWEGVDIPGEDLSCIIIVRLPFAPPTNPIISARSEALRRTGSNPFMELTLPQAILRFKQGFGRLVRTKADRGVVYVFDRRITTTKYGKYFIQSLPDITVIEGSTENLLGKLDNWL